MRYTMLLFTMCVVMLFMIGMPPREVVMESLLVIMRCNNQVAEAAYAIPHIVLECDPNFKDIYCADESYYYLTYLIENYDALPDRILFAHAHEYSWHYSVALSTMVKKLAPSPYFEMDMGGLYCVYNYWFTLEFPNNAELWDRLFQGTHLEGGYPSSFSLPCCGTFFVSRSQVHTNSLEFYVKILDNLKAWSLTDPILNQKRICGRVLEAAWAHVFNHEVVDLPPWC